MTWLVTGGAGYIGAHVVDALRIANEPVVVFDDLSTGEAARVGDTPVVQGSVLDEDLIRDTLRTYNVRGIVHIAAKKQVGESVAEPAYYYRENVVGTLRLLDAAVAEGVRSFVFSSSAATYGMPDVELVTEDTHCAPLSPYGRTKLIGEWAARDIAYATDLRVVSLRYFNVAGAARPELGDQGVFNLVPLALSALTSAQAPRIFGDDYPTEDGTCIRDYVHVADVADAHVVALRALDIDGPRYRVLNIGRGEGSSVREVLAMIADVTGLRIEPRVVARRAGDPARIVAAVDHIREELGWSARYDLRQIVESAWAGWQHRHGASATMLRSV